MCAMLVLRLVVLRICTKVRFHDFVDNIIDVDLPCLVQRYEYQVYILYLTYYDLNLNFTSYFSAVTPIFSSVTESTSKMFISEKSTETHKFY